MIGEVIGNFRLVASLGRGGAGEVFLAEHTGIQTKVAVKVLHAEVSRETDQVQRFFNEARIVGKIKHAGIAKIFDVGFKGDNAYLVMEFLEGESLRVRLDRGPLGIPELLEVSRQIASVLDSTHRAGVTHRDLKPDNVFLVADGDLEGRERVKVLDFGIAKLSGALELTATPQTRGTIGTPTYMAPEQWSDSSTVTWSADAYSLGCVMFELACGRPPFVAATIAEACSKHLMHTPVLVSSLRRDVPPRLDALIAKLLAKSPTERADSMASIAGELAAIAGRSSNPTMPPPTTTTHAGDSQPVTASTLDTLSPPPLSRTTLGISTGQLAGTLRRRRARMAVIGSAVAVVAIVLTVVVIATDATRSTTSHPGAAPAPTSSTSPAVPAALPPPSQPPPAPIEPAPTPTDAAEASPTSAAEAPSPTPEPPATKPTSKRRKRTKSTKPAPPASDKPAVIDLDGDGIPDTR